MGGVDGSGEVKLGEGRGLPLLSPYEVVCNDSQLGPASTNCKVRKRSCVVESSLSSSMDAGCHLRNSWKQALAIMTKDRGGKARSQVGGTVRLLRNDRGREACRRRRREPLYQGRAA